MGINLIIGCRRCRVRIWFYRGHLEGFEAFYREHRHNAPDWEETIDLTDDQPRLGDKLMEWRDIGVDYDAYRPHGAI